jgi:CRISPR/Cas system-associated exonuclease Cas4 (RecB family)
VAKKTSKANEPRRKLAERTETITVRLTPMQIEDERARVIDLLQEKDELEEKWKARKAEHKSQIAEIDSKRETALGMIRTGKVSQEVVIEEWLTDQNEVVRINKATREELNRRNATAAELQEELPLPPPPKKTNGHAEGADEEADEDDTDAEVDAEADSDFGEKA